MFKFELGQHVKNQIYNYVGVITARVEYISGCRQYLVKPAKLDENGQIQGGYYFDEDQLLPTGRGILRLKIFNPLKPKVNGGPQDNISPMRK